MDWGVSDGVIIEVIGDHEASHCAKSLIQDKSMAEGAHSVWVAGTRLTVRSAQNVSTGELGCCRCRCRSLGTAPRKTKEGSESMGGMVETRGT